MAVHAIVQTAQAPQSTPAQDQSSGGVSGDFADLLKHVYGKALTGSALLDAQSMIDMTGAAPAYTPPAPQPPAPPPTTTTSNSQSNAQATNASPSGSAGAPSASVATATDPNDSNNSGSGGQSGTSQQGEQQNSSQSNTDSSAVPTATAQATAPTKPANSNGDDATTEATAAVMAASAYVVQPTQPQLPTVEAVAQAAGPGSAAANAAAGANQNDAARAGQQAQAAADESTPDEAPIWSANFLSSAATTPQMAQQAAGLSQIAGSSGGTVSTQSTAGSGTSVAAPSASTLVPNAILAVSGFFSNGQHGVPAGDGSNGQDSAQQQGSDPAATDTGADSSLLGLAQDAQALMALASLTQSAAQGAIIGQTQGALTGVAATAAAAPSAAAGAEAALSQPSAQIPSASANTSNFASQVQNAEESEAPQPTRQIALPSAIDQLKMQIEKGLQSGSTTIKVQLTPDSLGRVDVKLDIQNGSVKATITADRPETVALLKSDQSGMVQALQDAGLNANSNSLSFYLRGDQQRQFAQNGRQGRNQSNNADSSGDPLLAGVTATSAASSAAGAGNLDISV